MGFAAPFSRGSKVIVGARSRVIREDAGRGALPRDRRGTFTSVGTRIRGARGSAPGVSNLVSPLYPMRTRCISEQMALFAVRRRATPVARERAPTGVLADQGGARPMG